MSEEIEVTVRTGNRLAEHNIHTLEHLKVGIRSGLISSRAWAGLGKKGYEELCEVAGVKGAEASSRDVIKAITLLESLGFTVSPVCR